MTKHERFLVRVMRKMFRAVGPEILPEATAFPAWYTTSSWTLAQENSFRDWLAGELTRTFHIHRNQARFEAGMFLLDYGWTLRESCADPKCEGVAGEMRKQLPEEGRGP
jgi:hypothetical protein